MKDLSFSGLGLRIEAAEYPQEADWKRLLHNVADAMSFFRGGEIKPYHVGKSWKLTPHPLPINYQLLASGHISYAVTVLAPHHKNEQRNIETKIDEACANLTKHAKNLDKRVSRILLIRIPEAASLLGCSKCAERWLAERPDAHLEMVIFYQPVVAATSIGGPTGIIHVIKVVHGPRFDRWRREVGQPNLACRAQVFVGICTDKPTKFLGTDGSDLGAQYGYQSGHMYMQGQIDREAVIGDISNPFPGIMVHSVMLIPGQQGNLVISGKFPPDSKLLLFS